MRQKENRLSQSLIYKLVFFFFCISFSLQPALACRYTVREIGYADYGTDNYKLFLYADKNVSQAMIADFKRITFAAYLDANIKSEVITVGDPGKHPAMKYYKHHKRIDTPLCVLVSPSGRYISFELSGKQEYFKESVWTLVKEIVISPVRKEIFNKIIQAYGIVLFVEGTKEHENKKALNEIELAIKDITEAKDEMPKAVDVPPVLIVLNQKQIKKEKVLLWSIGWKEEFADNPAVAVLYGRGRQMGKLLRKDLLKRIYVNNLLSIVGADCECGLERSWIMGAMLPLRWDKNKQNEVFKWHNFDAENPMVKAEISKILSISPSKTRKQGSVGQTTLYGYTEGEIEVIENQATAQEPIVENEEAYKFNSSNVIYWIGLLVLAVILVGVFVYIMRVR